MSKRLEFEDVKEEVGEMGLKLISDTYVNLKTELLVECNLAHRFTRTLTALRRNASCPVCDKADLNKSNIKLTSTAAIKKDKNKKRTLAIDNSTQLCGFAVFDDKELVYYGTISMNNADPIVRISHVRQWMVSMIDNWKPDIVALEDVQLQKNPKVFKILAQLLGVLINTLLEMNIEYYVVESTVWKSFNEVKGRARAAQKYNAQRKIEEIYGIKCSEDESDAILLGRYVVNKHIKHYQVIDWNTL